MNKPSAAYYNPLFETFPNQKQVKVIRENIPKNVSNRAYLCAYQDNIKEAMISLTPAAFKVYICLLFNADGFKLRFSPENIKNMTGLCKDTIRKAMTQLEKQGYIISIDWYRYIFRENKNLSVDTNNW